MDYYLKVLKNYWHARDFTGRSRRKEYWMFVLFNTIVGVVLQLAAMPLYAIYSLAVFIPALAVAVRRMHDVGKSGWYLLIPIYNLILACTDGDSEDNEYGSNPKLEANSRK